MKKLMFLLCLMLTVSALLAKEPVPGKSFQAPPFEPREDVILQEGFEGGVMPVGWTQSYVNGTVDWAYQNGGHYGNPGSAHTGDFNAFFYYNDYSGYSTKLITPALNLAGVYDAQLTFWLAMISWLGDLDELNIYYKTSASGSWVLLLNYTLELLDWTEFSLNLPNPTATYYIAFEGISHYGYGVCLDDVVITGTTSGGTMIDEDFSGGTFPPAGWSVLGDGTANWVSSTSSYAGGISPEACFSWSPSFTGNSYFLSPIILTSGHNVLYLSYKHMLDDYAGSNYSIGVVTTSNGGNSWNLVSAVYPGGSIGPENVNLTISNSDVGSNSFQFAFFFNGNSFNMDYWYIDNVVLSGSTGTGDIVSLANLLHGNFPNPFNPSTTIAFSLAEPGHVTIDVYNIRGEKVKTLIDADLTVSEHCVVWNGTDESGKRAASGVYFYKMISNNYSATRKMILLK